MIIKTAGVILITTLSFVLLKKDKPEFAFIIELCATVGLIVLILPFIEDILDIFSELSANVNMQFDFAVIITKSAGIAIVAKLLSELCKDAGENALSVKVEMAAKVLILVQTVPVIKALSELIITLAENVI